MLGAITGDIFASPYEFDPYPFEDVDLFARDRQFTDDTVLTIATADALLSDGDYTKAYRKWGHRYPGCSWGARFSQWLFGDYDGPYNSFGNGSAMRVSPVGWAFETLDETLAEAARSASVTHDHPEGIKGAQATAAAIFLARNRATKDEIRTTITDRFGYDLTRTIAEIRPSYAFNETCQGSVPEALIAFLEADDYEHTLRLVISLGGDADTQAAIAGSVAEAFFYRIPLDMKREILKILPKDMLVIYEKFCHRMEGRFRHKMPQTDPHIDTTPVPPQPRTPIPFGPTPKDVGAWLEEHETRCEPKHSCTIKDIDFNWRTLTGTCTVEFDNIPCPDQTKISYQINGKIMYSFPCIHSPLGVPCSYNAYSLSSEARASLMQALETAFPPLRAYGRQKDSGVIINALTPKSDRLPSNGAFDEIKQRLTEPDFEITINIADLKTD